MVRSLSRIRPLKNKTIIVTGAGGMLSSAFQELLVGAKCKKSFFFSHAKLDVTRRKDVLSKSRLKPDIIIHCAANVNVDGCEDYPGECNRVQAQGMKNIVDLAKKSNAVVFYPQTFMIFGNKAGLITESDKPRPLSKYGKSKLMAEEVLVGNYRRYLIVRMGGMFGGFEKDKNFVGKFARHLSSCIKDGVKQKDVGDRLWQPTYSRDLAYNSLVLLSMGKTGIYSMASHGEASFYDVAKEIADHFSLPISLRKVSSRNFPEKAKRPMRAILSNAKLKSEGVDFQRGWKESLNEYLDGKYFRGLFR